MTYFYGLKNLINEKKNSLSFVNTVCEKLKWINEN